MLRSLSRTVVAGGVVYPAGTAATPELEGLVTDPAHWSDGAVSQQVEANGEEGAPVETAEDEASGEYDGMRKAVLVAEVDRRNADRADGDQIVVGGTGKVADLIAALKADDGA